MAHELTLRANGRAEMAFVGETPWHGLGQSITKGASLGVWAKEAGMDWSAREGVPVAFGRHSTETASGREEIHFPGHKALWRSDTQAPLAIVGSGYNVVQPRDVLEFFRDMTESGGWYIHTAGTLLGGRKLWAMASNGEGAMVGGKKSKDEVMQNVLMATSLDGSMKTTVALTAVRVVCANTLALALDDLFNKNVVRISHRSVFDKQAVLKTLGLATNGFAAFMEKARELSETPIKFDEARAVLAGILDPKREEKRAAANKLAWLGDLSALQVAPEPEDSRTITGVLDLFGGLGMGSQLPGSKGTRWGLLNAVTQYVDHAMGRSDDTRLDSAFFGRGADLKKQAFAALIA